MFDVRIYFALLAIWTTGCCTQPKPTDRAVYRGPTESMDSVIQQINHNNARIPTLWTQLDYSATFVNLEKKTTDTVSGDGGLIYARPAALLLTGNKDVAGQVFQLGSNDTEFWVKLRSSADTYNYWWGHYANLGKPGCESIPIRPDLIVQVLGVGLYPSNLLQIPVPVMRFDNENDVYIFDLNARNVDRWETLEEIWYDRQTKLPLRVLLYDDNGRVTLKANLSQHTPVETANLPREQWPKVARHYDLFFPDTGSQISFDFLNDPELQHQARHSLVPNADSFKREEPDDNTKVIQIDKGCVDPSMLLR